MPQFSLHPNEAERRQHPRRPTRLPVAIESRLSGASIPCASMDVSVGGMRIASSTRVPLGPCDVRVSDLPGELLVLRGEVVEEIIDASTGEITARIVFLAASERLVALTDPETGRARRRGRLLLAGVLATALVVGTGGLVASGVEPDDAGAASPARPAAPVVRTEVADNAVRVVVGSSPEETSVASSVMPSLGIDDVKVQLNIAPARGGTVLPVQVTLENRGDQTLTFIDGLTAIVAVTRLGVTVTTVALTAPDLTEVAAHQVVTVDGFVDFGAPGEYDVTAEIDLADSARGQRQ